ncbi:MAG: PEP-CTERM sorting domain-containing protein [Armatimonadota bacterium]
MKKLIVLGIIATMVMGLAAAASAQDIDNSWTVQLRAANALGVGAGNLSLGVKPTAIDAYTTAGAEDGAYGPYTGVPGTIVSAIMPADTRVNKDMRAPLQANETKSWDILMFAVGGAPQNMTLSCWVQAGPPNTLEPGGNLRVWLEHNGEEIWEAPFGKTGSMTNPDATFSYYYDGTPLAFTLYASTVAPVEVPEPGSMLAMFSGLVGLVGFGIRRRK